MSGIAGIIRFDGGPIERGLIESMTSAMPYRGPDGIAHWLFGSVALGQCMLRTTPESLEETQPLANEDESLVLVMDGRIDNWEELRSELLARGARLRTSADAELVLRAYEIWGGECLAHIDGDFALAIWDARRKQLFCARDRLGNKPFTWHWDGKVLTFASELHAILALPWVPEIPNQGMIAELIADEWYTVDETLWTGVMRLPAAHRMSVGAAAGPKPERYWEPDLWTALPCTSDEEYIEQYRSVFADCVRRLSRSHLPVTCDVSGGLDSSAVFCMAEHLRREGKLPAPSIGGYTIAFADYADMDDLPYARLVGQRLGVPIHEVPPMVRGYAWFQDQARRFRDFPGYPLGGSSFNVFAKAGAAGSRVLVTGNGGDQFLGGLQAHYAEELASGNWMEAYRCFRQDVKNYGAASSLHLLVRRGLLPLTPEGIKRVLRPLPQMLAGNLALNGQWLATPMRSLLESRRKRLLPHQTRNVRRHGQRHLLEALYYPFDSFGRELYERTSAQSGFEIRSPFYSSRFVQFAFQTPERLRSRVEQGKYIHIMALDGILPREILERTTKADGGTFVADYLMPLAPFLTIDLPQSRPNWITARGIRDIFDAYRCAPGEGWHGWALMNLIGCDLVMPRQDSA